MRLEPGVSLPTSDVTYAGLGGRLGAFSIDILLVVVAALGIGLALSLSFPATFVSIDVFDDEVLSTREQQNDDTVVRVTIFDRTYWAAQGVEYAPCPFSKIEVIWVRENGTDFTISFGARLLDRCEYKEKPNAAKIALLLGFLFYAPVMESQRRRATPGQDALRVAGRE